MRVLCIACGSHLLVSSFGEANTEESQEEAINSLGLYEGFNEGVPFLDEGAELVLGDVEAVEVGVAIVSLDFFNLDLYFSPGVVAGASIQISQRYFEYSAFQTVS